VLNVKKIEGITIYLYRKKREEIECIFEKGKKETEKSPECSFAPRFFINKGIKMMGSWWDGKN